METSPRLFCKTDYCLMVSTSHTERCHRADQLRCRKTTKSLQTLREFNFREFIKWTLMSLTFSTIRVFISVLWILCVLCIHVCYQPAHVCASQFAKVRQRLQALCKQLQWYVEMWYDTPVNKAIKWKLIAHTQFLIWPSTSASIIQCFCSVALTLLQNIHLLSELQVRGLNRIFHCINQHFQARTCSP